MDTTWRIEGADRFPGSGDEYHTPDGTKRCATARWLGCHRLSFGFHVFLQVMRCRRAALRGQFDDQAFADSARNIARLIERFGARVHLTGLKNLRAMAPSTVLISNHMSTLETFVLPSIVVPFQPLTFVVKRSLTTHPIFGPVMRAREPIAVDRTNPREDLKRVMTEGAKRLAAGNCICVFPQSTRRVTFDERQFNSIGAKLAHRAGAPVLPFALRTDFWGNGSGAFKDFGPIGTHMDVHFAFGASLPTSLSARETQQEVVRFVREHMIRWGVPRIDALGEAHAGGEA